MTPREAWEQANHPAPEWGWDALPDDEKAAWSAVSATPLAACGVTFSHDWHGYLADDGRTRVCDGEPRVSEIHTPPGASAVEPDAGERDA